MSYTRSNKVTGKRRSATSKCGAAASRSSTRRAANDEGDELVTHVTRASGNVFEDIGFPPDEARKLLLRSDLMTNLERIMKARRWSQARAAKVFGVTRRCVARLNKGKIDEFNIDTLARMLERAGADVNISVTPRRA